MTRRPLFLALSLLAGFAAPAAAQVAPRDTDVVDRIVAVVGDSVVLLTQVQEEVERMRLQTPGSVPSNAAGLEALYRQLLDTWVNRLLIVQAAAKDTLVKVDEPRVEEVVNQEIQQRAKQYPRGQPELQEALAREGLTLSEYREILSTQVRQDQLQQMFVQRRLQDAAPVEVSEAELRQAFSEASAQLQSRPRLLTFEQVVMAPQASDSAKAAARAEAQALLDSIRAGGDFEALAKAHSDDPGSGEIGGDLGWFRRGAMVKEFEDAAFALADGQVSDVVETEFGFHIIKVERSRQGERKGRHILIRPTVGSSDAARARVRADSVVALARAGTSMAELFQRYSDPLAPDTLTVSFDQLDQLPPGYDAMRTAVQGQVVGPIEYDTGRGETRLAVVRVRDIREAGAYTFEDVKPQLAQQVQRAKQMQRLLEELRARTHVEIRM
jgi:peptidyl-prolyl cis-trans isomerase SurA